MNKVEYSMVNEKLYKGRLIKEYKQ